MNYFRLHDSEVPDRLWRVNYPRSTPFSQEHGFTARNSCLHNLNNPAALHDAIEKAFTWKSREPSPFVAVMSDREHAKNWAKAYTDRTGEWSEVVEIDTSKLQDTPIMKLSDITAQMGIELKEGAAQHEDDGFLCVGGIPAEAVADVMPFEKDDRYDEPHLDDEYDSQLGDSIFEQQDAEDYHSNYAACNDHGEEDDYYDDHADHDPVWDQEDDEYDEFWSDGGY